MRGTDLGVSAAGVSHVLRRMQTSEVFSGSPGSRRRGAQIPDGGRCPWLRNSLPNRAGNALTVRTEISFRDEKNTIQITLGQ